MAARVGGPVMSCAGSLRSRLRRREEIVVVGAAALALLVTAFLPLVLVAFQVEAFRLDASRVPTDLRILGHAAELGSLLVRSVAIAGAVTVLALLAGVPLAILLARTDVAARRWILALHALPMFLPPFLLALGWFYLLGRRGLVSAEATAVLLFSTLGLIAILTLAFTPVVTALVALGVQAIDPSLEEAARLVARPWRVATRVLLPLAWPAAALAALIVFALAFSELGVAAFLRVRTYPAVVFARLGGIQYAPTEAAVLALPLIVVALVLLALERWLVRRRSFAVLGLRAWERPVLPLGRWRAPLTAACWTAAALSVLPLVSLALRAGWTGLTAAPSWIGGSLGNSLLSATLAATVIVLLGVGLGPSLARRRPGTAFFDALAVLAFVTPAALLGVGLIAVWNRPATQFLYGSLGIIVIGYVARYAAIGVRTMAVAVAQASPHLEEAAAAAGARFGRRLVRIVVPLQARAVATAWLLALVFCLRDLETAVLFYPPGGEPLPVRIFTLEANGPEEVVAGLAIVHVMMTATALVAGGALVLRGWRRA